MARHSLKLTGSPLHFTVEPSFMSDPMSSQGIHSALNCATQPVSNCRGARVIGIRATWPAQLELELIQTQMTQKPMLRAEVYARALRASQNRKEDSL